MITFLAVIVLVIGITIIIVSGCVGDIDSAIGGMFGSMLILFGIVGIADYFNPTPSAIDVYRGKTELKITGTYKDSIFVPTDTTVVFKNN